MYVELYFKTYYGLNVFTNTNIHVGAIVLWAPHISPMPSCLLNLMNVKMPQNIIKNKQTCMYMIYFSKSDFSSLNFPVIQDVCMTTQFLQYN